jgi:hypothetical protein
MTIAASRVRGFGPGYRNISSDAFLSRIIGLALSRKQYSTLVPWCCSMISTIRSPRRCSFPSRVPSFTWDRMTVRERPGERASWTFNAPAWFSEK